jgi:hypothetical protein
MQGPVFYPGHARVIEAAVLLDGSMPAKDFIDSLSDGDQAKLYALFRLLGDTGWIRNQEKFKKVEGTEFFEFKSFQVRMPCFFMGDRRVVVTHGFRKKKEKIPRGEIERAKRIREEHLNREGEKQ